MAKRDRSNVVNLRVHRDVWEKLVPLAERDSRSTANLAHLCLEIGMAEYKKSRPRKISL